jgi:CHASE3 domain sensor protein
LDSVAFNDTIAKKSTLSLFRGIVFLALAVVTLFVVYLSHNAYTAVADDRDVQEIAETLEPRCARAGR